jgi:hypothetical protein
MSIIPGQNAILVTDPAVGATTFALGSVHGKNNSAAFSGQNNTATTAIPIDGQGAVCWSVRSKKTGSFFVSDIKTSIISEIAVNRNLTGRIVGARFIDVQRRTCC